MQQKENSLLERSAYAELYQYHAPGLFAYVYQETRSREDAEDIVLDVFLAILQYEHFLNFEKQKQEAWLWRIARNKVVDYYRHMARRQNVSIDWLSEPLYEEEYLSPEQLSLKREEYALLFRVIQDLPAIQQEVLRLRFGHGLKCKEIAPVLAKSEGAIRILLLRTLQRLRGFYQDQGKEGKA